MDGSIRSDAGFGLAAADGCGSTESATVMVDKDRLDSVLGRSGGGVDA